MTEETNIRKMIQSVCGDDLTAEPAKFLASLMAGRDPRERESDLYRLIKQIRDEERKPKKDEWTRICQMVLYTDLYRPVPVSLDESHKAARQLMEYLHAKKKSVSVRGKIAHKVYKVTDLSPDEIAEFEAWFTSEF